MYDGCHVTFSPGTQEPLGGRMDADREVAVGIIDPADFIQAAGELKEELCFDVCPPCRKCFGAGNADARVPLVR